jgi:hypothetical protein
MRLRNAICNDVSATVRPHFDLQRGSFGVGTGLLSDAVMGSCAGGSRARPPKVAVSDDVSGVGA